MRKRYTAEQREKFVAEVRATGESGGVAASGVKAEFDKDLLAIEESHAVHKELTDLDLLGCPPDVRLEPWQQCRSCDWTELFFAPKPVDEPRPILREPECRETCPWPPHRGWIQSLGVSDTDPPGYATSYSYPTPFGHIGGEVCLMDLPLELCVQNMELYQACTATLEQLDDCVESIRIWPGNARVGHGCGPLLSNDSCANLIVQPMPQGAASSDCKVPVGEAAQ